jgi:hypothetical protein
MDHCGVPLNQANLYRNDLTVKGIAMNNGSLHQPINKPKRGRPFEPGNKHGRGRPRGSRNKAARACQEALDNHAESLIKKCLSLADQGNMAALRILMDRLVPPLRQRPLQFKLPRTKTIAAVSAASELVLGAVTRGQLTPAEGENFSRLLDGRRRMIEAQELEERVRALEDLNKASIGLKSGGRR